MITTNPTTQSHQLEWVEGSGFGGEDGGCGGGCRGGGTANDGGEDLYVRTDFSMFKQPLHHIRSVCRVGDGIGVQGLAAMRGDIREDLTWPNRPGLTAYPSFAKKPVYQYKKIRHRLSWRVQL